MNQHGVLEEEAIEELKKPVSNVWSASS